MLFRHSARQAPREKAAIFQSRLLGHTLGVSFAGRTHHGYMGWTFHWVGQANGPQHVEVGSHWTGRVDIRMGFVIDMDFVIDVDLWLHS